MTDYDHDCARRQRTELDRLAVLWRDDIEVGTGEGLQAAMASFRGRMDRSSGKVDAVAVMDLSFAEALQDAYAVETPRQRLDDLIKRRPEAAASPEANFFRQELTLIKTVESNIDKAGTTDFDGVLRDWATLDLEAVSIYGLDYGLRKTLSLMVPLARARLDLALGEVTPDELLATNPEHQEAPDFT